MKYEISEVDQRDSHYPGRKEFIGKVVTKKSVEKLKTWPDGWSYGQLELLSGEVRNFHRVKIKEVNEMENKLVIDGKEITLSDETVKSIKSALGKEEKQLISEYSDLGSYTEIKAEGEESYFLTLYKPEFIIENMNCEEGGRDRQVATIWTKDVPKGWKPYIEEDISGTCTDRYVLGLKRV